ncbi:MAG: hypothetical protein JWO68_4280 [Actinomycetia bacterium]|nr:hypothetical protein [Actinomycetes bacterium]
MPARPGTVVPNGHRSGKKERNRWDLNSYRTPEKAGEQQKVQSLGQIYADLKPRGRQDGSSVCGVLVGSGGSKSRSRVGGRESSLCRAGDAPSPPDVL